MANRKERAKIAQETLKILEDGSYTSKTGKEINIKGMIASSISGSILYTPESLTQLTPDHDNKIVDETVFSVTNESTFTCAKKLQSKHGKVLCLNFASAKNPGGGFLGGSQAQEEALARASALYPTIAQMESMYTTNRQYQSCLYTDHMIYSPDIPVFRDEEDELLEAPWLTSIITAPAVNFGALRESEKKSAETVMRRRINGILNIACDKGYSNLVLGAWGCGVFKNDPQNISQYFFDALGQNGTFHKVFQRIDFAVLDSSKEKKFITPFYQRFSKK